MFGLSRQYVTKKKDVSSFLVYELFASSTILFQGPQPLHFLDFFMKLHKHIFSDISLSYLCSILTLSHVGQELWLDLQTDHMSKIGHHVRGRIVIRAITLERRTIE